MATSKGLPKMLPKGYKVVETSAGTYLQKSKQSRKRYKMSKSARNKIAAAARRFKLPVLTVGALAGGTWQPINLLFQGQGQYAMQVLVRNYTGINTDFNGSVEFKPRYMLNGLVPIVAVMLINRSGILRPTNQKLAKTKIPVRFS